MWFLCDNVCQWLAAGRWYFQGTPDSSTNKTGRIKLTVTKQEVYCFISTVIRLLMNKIHTWLLMKIKCTHDCSWKKSTLSIIRPRYSRLFFFFIKIFKKQKTTTKRVVTSSSSHWKLTCSRRDIAEKLP
jgi:hypothetical protein